MPRNETVKLQDYYVQVQVTRQCLRNYLRLNQQISKQSLSDFKISSYTTSGLIQNLENLEEITESMISRDIPMFLSWGGDPPDPYS